MASAEIGALGTSMSLKELGVTVTCPMTLWVDGTACEGGGDDSVWNPSHFKGQVLPVVLEKQQI